MPTPLGPTRSDEIVPISPPPKRVRRDEDGKRKRDRLPLSSNDSQPLSASSRRESGDLAGQDGGYDRARHPGQGMMASINDDNEIQSIETQTPPTYTRRQTKQEYDPSAATTLPRPRTFSPSTDLREAAYRAKSAYDKKEALQTGKRKIRKGDVRKTAQQLASMNREQITANMMTTLGKDSNPITNSDLYTRTDHFVSAATGHQVSNRGGGSSGAKTYWEVRTAKMVEQAREQKTDLLKGLVFYINGSTGPRVSNLQVQHIITAHGGRFLPVQGSSCTHILAANLSGSKTQKWIDGQAGRGGAKRMKVVRIDWLLDSVEKGMRLSEVPYSVISNPSQHSILSAFAPKASPDTPL